MRIYLVSLLVLVVGIKMIVAEDHLGNLGILLFYIGFLVTLADFTLWLMIVSWRSTARFQFKYEKLLRTLSLYYLTPVSGRMLGDLIPGLCLASATLLPMVKWPAVEIQIILALVIFLIVATRELVTRRGFRSTVIKMSISLTLLVAGGSVFLVRSQYINVLEHQNSWNIPTIWPKSLLLVDIQKNSPISRFDWIVYRQKYGDSFALFCARVVAFGGEAVEVKELRVFIDGSEIPLFRMHASLDSSISPGVFGVRGAPYVVPGDQVFVLGDNEDHVCDSRHMGPVARSRIVGIAYKVFWPPEEAILLRDQVEIR
jgi:signal peptidase I